MKWPVKHKDNIQVGSTREVRKFAWIPQKTSTHWVWLGFFFELQVYVQVQYLIENGNFTAVKQYWDVIERKPV